MMDAAFHASVGLLVRSIHDDADSHELSLPFAMQEVEVFGSALNISGHISGTQKAAKQMTA